MPRGTTMWINANASAPRAGDYTLAFAAEMLLPFDTEEAMRRCAQEIIDVLRRYGIKADWNEDAG